MNILNRLKSMQRSLFPTASQKAYQNAELQIKNTRTEFYGSFLGKNELCFDVGANMGNRVAAFLEIGARVVAVEPQTPCIQHLKSTFGDAIEIVETGVGAQVGKATFHLSSAHTLSSFSEEWISAVSDNRFKNENWSKTVEMELTTLDILINKFGLPKFIKIDVEGFEQEVLKGLTQPIPYISYEYTVPEQTAAAINCLKLIAKNSPFTECNYSVGESMKWALKDWKSPDEFISYIESEEFLSTEFGDIYVRVAGK